MLPIACVSSVFVFVLLCITLCPFWFCNHLEEEERELVALLSLSCKCVVAIGLLWLLLAVPWVGLRCVFVVFPGHTVLLICFLVKCLTQHYAARNIS